MNNINETKASTCDWCLIETPVQAIEEKLWEFWKRISAEDQNVICKNICQKCKSRYEDFSTYIGTCKTHESIIEETLSGKQIKCEAVDTPSIDIEYHHPLTKTELVNQEHDSDLSSLTSSSQLRVHKSKRHRCEICFKCPQCDQCFSMYNELINHVHVHVDEMPYMCPQCYKCFTSISHLQKHLQMHNGTNYEKPFECFQCGECFNMSYELNSHLDVHVDKKAFKCSQCDECFTTSSNLKKHLRRHNNPYTCPQCDEAFLLRSCYEKHLMLHTAKKPFKCTRCGKHFIHLTHLKKHLESHGGLYKCSQCGECFTFSSNLKKHLQRHSEPYKCSQCGKCFSISYDLEKHFDIHGKNFKCFKCYRFFTYSAFTKHSCQPISENPLKCTCYKKNFKSSEEYSNHIAKCTQCDQCVCYPSELTRHVWSRPCEKPYRCSKCGECFEAGSSLSKHVDEHYSKLKVKS